ncbi:MAG: sigma-54-dependent Fis family transcriptional regulator [Deltaproteobacteria bacterium]|nr:sigma-54-dependent Fis family transcriptional regulator [Deltaproteobacteria bacterium]
MRRPVLLVVDDEKNIRDMLELILAEHYDVLFAENGTEALKAVKTKPVDMVLMDVNLPGRDGLPGMDGLRTLELVKEFDPETEVVMLSGENSAQQAVSALKKGAYDYITKPFDSEDLLLTLKRLSERLKLKNEVGYLKEELRGHTGQGEIISRSPRMRTVFELINAVSQTSSSVLITGESGTGKELVARAIQSKGPRKDKPFVAVNCGAVPSELMESELFGHEKGSFTGAHARKTGKFEYADGGTLFLDEVSTLPMHLQVKLLRVLQEKSFERVGSNIPIKVDIRVIAATNLDLEKEVRKGNFREDLYYRLKVVPIELPPLRERREDIPLLIHHFLKKHAQTFNKPVPKVSAEAINALRNFSWPGNIRELENLIERLVVLSKAGREITYDDLPVGMFTTDVENHPKGPARDFREAVESFERHYIIGVLNKTNWNKLEAARRMKVHRNTLLLKMKALKIKKPRDINK